MSEYVFLAGAPGVEYWQNARPITRESFLAAYVDANPWRDCHTASETWNELHARFVLRDEIDEDPPNRLTQSDMVVSRVRP